jgi:CRISPR-associated protein Cas2
MTSDNAHRYLIAYDIPDNKRRLRVSKRLLTHGDRIQYSVFVADVKAAKLLRLRNSITDIIDLEQDSVLICDLGPTNSLDPARFSFIGTTKPVTPDDIVIL